MKKQKNFKDSVIASARWRVVGMVCRCVPRDDEFFSTYVAKFLLILIFIFFSCNVQADPIDAAALDSAADCGALKDNLSSCTKFTCVDQLKFGKSYKMVVEQQNDQCHYKEFSKNFGGVDCHFPMKSLGSIASILTDSAGNSKEIFGQYCTDISGEVVEAKTPENFTKSSAQNQGVEPGISGQMAGSSLINNDDKDEIRYIKKSKMTTWQYSSLMFSAEELSKINEILVAQGIDISGGNSSESEADSAGLIKDYASKNIKKPSYLFLSALLYIKPKNWAIWVNGEKIANDMSNPNISIEKISAQEVNLAWTLKDLDTISPDWHTKFQSVDGRVFNSGNANLSIIVDQDLNKTIKVVLRPNQSLSLNDWEIVEGKIY